MVFQSVTTFVIHNHSCLLFSLFLVSISFIDSRLCNSFSHFRLVLLLEILTRFKPALYWIDTFCRYNFNELKLQLLENNIQKQIIGKQATKKLTALTHGVPEFSSNLKRNAAKCIARQIAARNMLTQCNFKTSRTVVKD